MRKLHVTRRELVVAATAGGAFAAVPPAWGRGLLARRPRVGPGRFRDGVASGEPSDTAVTFWSRLETPRPRSGARLVIARDEGMRDVVATTIVPTGEAINGTLKARVGGLAPNTPYFYVWESGNDISDIGRTRTALPAGSNEPLRIGYSSCQHYALGYFSAHRHAALQDLDLYLFLGDYVYERGGTGELIRPDPINATDLRSYRRKYRRYRSDRNLRELHRLHPVAHVWDDHEVSNNYSNRPEPPAAAQTVAAYRAAFEWLPRMTFPNERHRLYKQLSYGAMADVFLLDVRQYRTPGRREEGAARHLLGEAQLGWLVESLKRSTARWKVIGQQVVVAAGVDPEGTLNNDAWDGYPEDRTVLLGEIERAGIQNVVFLTGDAHVFMANLLASDFDALGQGTRAPSAVEYVGGSVTSPSRNAAEEAVQQAAPWNRMYNGFDHGYALMELNDSALVTQYLAADRTLPNAETAPFERFTQPVGANQFERQRLV